MNVLPLPLESRLDQARATGLEREIRLRSGSDFSSNDYLGLSQSAELRSRVLWRLEDESVPLGASGSRLLRGSLDLHDVVEEELAHFCGREAALLFPSGYQANLALLGGLLQEGDTVYSDERNHASLIDGIRLSGARKWIYPHLDLDALEHLLAAPCAGTGLRVVVTESVFSMDGDVADLRRLASLAKQHSALLVVDEAHATGIWGGGEQGGGLVQSLGLEREVLATIHTGGKALGSGGAWIACDRNLRHYLIQFGRAFLFSTAPYPFLAVGLQEAVRYWRGFGKKAATEVRERATQFRGELGLRAPEPDVPIIPLICGSNVRALQITDTLQRAGFDVRAIRPPTVPKGSARLRVTMSAGVPRDEMLRLVRNLKTVFMTTIAEKQE